MMSELKAYELTLEATHIDGNQVFACLAASEDEAIEKLNRGECAIIEENLEVIGLEKTPFEIVESDDISSRLSTDLLSNQSAEMAQLRKELEDIDPYLTDGESAAFKAFRKAQDSDCCTEDCVHDAIVEFGKALLSKISKQD